MADPGQSPLEPLDEPGRLPAVRGLPVLAVEFSSSKTYRIRDAIGKRKIRNKVNSNLVDLK